MLSCKEASALVSYGLDRNLSLMERLGVRVHLSMCKYCRRYQKQLRIIRNMARQYEAMQLSASHSERLSVEAFDRLTRTLKERSHPKK